MAKRTDPDKVPRTFVLADKYEPTRGSWHRHKKAQLVHAAEGVLHVTTSQGSWIAPPHRAIWVPANTEHRVSSRRPFRLLTLYTHHHPFADQNVATGKDECRVVAVNRLVEELLNAAAAIGTSYRPNSPESRLMQVILDRLPALAVAPLFHLPTPTSKELAKITSELANNPSDRRTIDEWAKSAGLGAKTCARRFVAETGITFGQWRRQCRLAAAVEALAAGQSVTRVAFEVGYDDVSSFITTFKEAMGGVTPARFFAA